MTRTQDADAPDGGERLPWYLDEQLAAWREEVRRFAGTDVAALVAGRETGREIDPMLTSRLADLGVFSLRLKPPYGRGWGVTGLSIAVEEIARVDASAAAAAHSGALNSALFDSLANDRQREAILPGIVGGEAVIAVAITEPDGGSDAGSVRTRAHREPGGWRLRGSKAFISNSGHPLTSHVVVFAALDDDPHRPRVSAFLVPIGAPGVVVGERYRLLGWSATDVRPLQLDDVFVGEDATLGEEGRGLSAVLRFLTWGRLPFAALGVGLSQGALDSTTAFVRSRSSFGKGLGEHQAVAFGLAEMAAQVAAARAVTYDACWKHDHDQPYRIEAAIAKLVSSEIANRVTYRATQLHGAYGVLDDGDVARRYRDARVLTIAEGTSEMQKLLIARELGVGH